MSDQDKKNEINHEDPFDIEPVRDPSSTAEEFLQKLDLVNDRWQGGPPWVFRGQNDAQWKLQPSLFRRWNIDSFPQFEIQLIDDFIRNANTMNMPIPANSLGYKSHTYNSVTRTIRQLNSTSGYGTSYDFSHVAWAIAQHSGVYTRLLDFSYSSLVAAYFAADTTNLLANLRLSGETQAEYFADFANQYQHSLSDAVDTLICRVNEYRDRMTKLPKEIAVWAIRANDLMQTTLTVLDHPYLEIPYLRAQEGLFLCDTKHEREKPALDSYTFNSELEKLIPTRGIYKLTLPYEQRPRLFELLGRKRVSVTHLKPSYERIAEAVLKGYKSTDQHS